MSWDIACLHASQTKHKHKDTRKYGSASPAKLRNAFPFFFNSLSGQSLCDLYSARDSQRPYDGHLVMWSCGNLWPAIPYRIHIKRARKRCTERVIYLGQSCPNTRKWRQFFSHQPPDKSKWNLLHSKQGQQLTEMLPGFVECL